MSTRAPRSLAVLALVASLTLLSACGGGTLKPTMTQILVTPGKALVGKGKTIQLKATGIFSDGTVLDLTALSTWGTTQAGIAAVSAGGTLSGVTAGNATITAAYKGMTGTDAVTVQPATLVSIAILPSGPSVGKSKTVQLTATGTYSDGTTQDVTAQASWATSQANVASVSSGLVTGIKAGSVQVTAAYQGSSANDAVTIEPPTVTSIMINPASPTIRKSKSQQLTATGSFSDGTTQDITSQVSWGTNKPTVAGVNNSGAVTGMTPGSAIISAAYQGVTGTDAVTIQAPRLLSIAITPTNLTIHKSDVFQMVATGSFDDGTQEDISKLAAWNTTQPGIAYVATGGMMTGSAAGAAQITATYQSVTGTDNVVILNPTLVSVTVSPAKSLILIGENEQLIATAKWNDGSSLDVTRSTTWTSMSTSTVAVSAAGMVLGNAAGAANINAQYNGMSASAKVAVTSATAQSIAIQPNKVSLALGSDKQLKAIATLSDGTTLDITAWANWASAQTDIVQMGGDGDAMAERVGTSQVTASASGVSNSIPVSVYPAATGNYFDVTGSAVTGALNTVRLTNPGITGENLCSMIYVFDEKQELTECCGCMLTDSGLRTLSVQNDLTANPLTANPPLRGYIDVVPSDPANNPTCDPRSLSPAGLVLGWGTNSQLTSSSTTSAATAQMTEMPFTRSPLSTSGVQVLAATCTALQRLGSGRGVCSCGTGD